MDKYPNGFCFITFWTNKSIVVIVENILNTTNDSWKFASFIETISEMPKIKKKIIIAVVFPESRGN